MSDTTQIPPAYRISAAAAKNIQAEGALLVDVRGLSGRVRDGEVAEAIIIPKAKAVDTFTRKLALNAPEQKIVVFCSSVKGSTPVVEALIEAGLSHVYEVDGGAPAFIAATAD